MQPCDATTVAHGTSGDHDGLRHLHGRRDRRATGTSRVGVTAAQVGRGPSQRSSPSHSTWSRPGVRGPGSQRFRFDRSLPHASRPPDVQQWEATASNRRPMLVVGVRCRTVRSICWTRRRSVDCAAAVPFGSTPAANRCANATRLGSAPPHPRQTATVWMPHRFCHTRQAGSPSLPDGAVTP